jgi:phenylacetate-CoA ligase
MPPDNRVTRWGYEHSPILLQHAATSLWGWKLNRGKYGRYYHDYVALLKDAQWRSEGELRDRQNANLRKLVSHAYHTVPYYRELFRKLKLTPADIVTSHDLAKIPVLDKATLRREGPRLRSEGFPRHHTRTAPTSGTSGMPLTIFLSQNCHEREYAFQDMHYSWAGFNRGEPLATFTGTMSVPARQDRPPFWRTNRAANQIIFSARHMSAETLPFYAAALSAMRPALINGYPSAIFLLARFLDEHQQHGIRPKAVFTSSETLQDFQRTTITKAFGCPVFNWYGNTECVAHTTECECGGQHNQLLHSVLEVVDNAGNPTRDGQAGHVIGTGLDNWAMPLIRYRVGDVAITTSRKCPCGRGYPLIENITGRIEDYIVTPEKRHVPAVALTHVFTESPGVREAQLIQERVDLLRVQIVQAETYSGADRRNAERQLRLRLGNSMRFQIEVVPEIPLQESGKRRYFISRLPAKYLALCSEAQLPDTT